MSLIDQLRQLQSSNAVDLNTTLQTVEINPIEVCNRSCSFCPRSQPEVYGNSKSTISINTITAIADSLFELSFSNRVSFVGFGEPLLFKNLAKSIEIIAAKNPKLKWIEVNTNGDYISRTLVNTLIDAGCTNLTISMYDRDISEKISNLLSGLRIDLTFKHAYMNTTIVVNRTEMISTTTALNINRPCYLPFYKMFIDWNGDVILCNNDWGRSNIFGNVNVTSIKDIWFSDKLTQYRKQLLQGNRAGCITCNKCDINGTQFGKQSVDIVSDFIK